MAVVMELARPSGCVVRVHDDLYAGCEAGEIERRRREVCRVAMAIQMREETGRDYGETTGSAQCGAGGPAGHGGSAGQVRADQGRA